MLVHRLRARTLVRHKASTDGEGSWLPLVLALLQLLFPVLEAQFSKPHQMGWLGCQGARCLFCLGFSILVKLIPDATVLKALIARSLFHYF